jgi:Asp-tRNA(Asn)/Glu-tRNA(Gln) amidotransferase A subunit family amidase
MVVAAAQAPPDELELTVRDRQKLLDAGTLSTVELAVAANRWSACADERYRACVQLRPVDSGIRVGVKDLVDVRGFSTRLGTPGHRQYPDRTAAALRRLPSLAINAKLVTTELGIGLRHGCVNPYFPHLDPAGSSTGSAVAVAAGICDLALGTDTVASVRLPAAACGVVGLRLTHDPLLMDGVWVLSPSLDAPGWLTRTIDDLAYLWHRFELGRALTAPPSRPVFRVGVPTEVLGDDIEAETRSAYEATCAMLADVGHDVMTVSLGDLFFDRGLAYELCSRDAWNAYQANVDRIADPLDQSTRYALESGAAVDDDRLRELRARQGSYRAEVDHHFASHGLDAWLMPAGTLPPRNLFIEDAPEATIPDAKERTGSLRVNYATMASFGGLPGIAFPVGFSRVQHAPIGLQAIGPRHGETRLIALAQTVSELTGAIRYRLGPPPARLTLEGMNDVGSPHG